MRYFAAILLGACSFSGGGNAANPDGGGDGGGDAGGDGGIDAPFVACTDWGERRFFDPCDMQAIFEAPATAPAFATNGTWVINTDDAEITDPDAQASAIGSLQTLTDAYGNTVDVHLVVVAGLRVPTNVTIRAVGSRPLVIASTIDIDVDGEIDLNTATRNNALTVGAGAGSDDDGVCPAVADGTNDAQGGSGAGGGAMAFAGGAGGDGDNGNVGGVTGSSPYFDLQSPLHGGCPGGKGGDGDTGAGGVGGSGGGAVVLSAVGEIQVMGRIGASGSGGLSQVDPRRNGGGGGGSGGLIALEAPTVNTRAPSNLAANGGGGGGGSNNAVDPDIDGRDGDYGTTRAIGGDGDNSGGGDTTGDGGGGGAGTQIADFAGLDGQLDARGGGGGGGSCGAILVIAPTANIEGTLSPVATLDEPPFN